MEDDYGDGAISQLFYNGEILEDQKRTARRTRILVEEKIGRFSTRQSLVGQKANDVLQTRRAGSLFTRPLTLPWVPGSPEVAETSFFKNNSQGTPLDVIEEMLIRNRRKPIAIGARAVLRSGMGHKYRSKFSQETRNAIERLAVELYGMIFEPEAPIPLATKRAGIVVSATPAVPIKTTMTFVATKSR
jgi:hypothetical protein